MYKYFIAMLLVCAPSLCQNTWNQNELLSVRKWLNTLWSIPIMEYYAGM